MLSCLISQLRCLICGSSCVLCCPICPSVNESTSTRLAFAAFLLFGTFVSTLMTSPYFFDDLTAIPADDHFRNSSNCDESELGARCPITTGSLIVYRISFAMFLFYLIFMLVTARVKTSKSFRAKLHNGFWLWKILLICCLTSIAFKCSFNGFWRDVWMYTGMVASCAYVIINMLFMIEISYSWTEKILQKERCKSFWYLLLIFSIITLIVISILLTIYLHIHFAPSRRCQLNSAFITLISTTCFFFFIFAIIVAAKTKKAYTYLLPTAFMTAYVLFMTWSTLTSIPKSDSTIGKEQPQWCAPDIEVVNIDQKYVAYISVFISVFVTIATSIKTSARSRSLGVPIEPSTPKKKAKKSNKHKSSSSLCCCLCLCLKRRGKLYYIFLSSNLLTDILIFSR